MAGADATQEFEDVFHNAAAKEMMPQYYIGEVEVCALCSFVARGLISRLRWCVSWQGYTGKQMPKDSEVGSKSEGMPLVAIIALVVALVAVLYVVVA